MVNEQPIVYSLNSLRLSIMHNYFRIMRLDHWIKQIFIVPGFISAMMMTGSINNCKLLLYLFIALLATSMIASANYVINEWLDADFDRFHPIKKNRSAVSEQIEGKYVFIFWIMLAAMGLLIGTLINSVFLLTLFLFWIMGIIYNVKPFRTKDVPVLDVLTESINNMIRLLLGWFAVSSCTLPPGSLILGYWMLGAFLMDVKRYAEYRMINNPDIAGKYRKSFRYYTLKSLLVSSVFYAMLSILFIGVFLIKYRIELILFMPFFIGLVCYYLFLSYSDDSAVQKPEKLYHEKKLMLYCGLLIGIFSILMVIDIPQLSIFTSNELIHFRCGGS